MRALQTACRAAAIGAGVLAAASPCLADPFCDALQKVAAAAPSDFAGLYKTIANAPDSYRYAATFDLPGAVPLRMPVSAGYEPCHVQTGLVFYDCTFAAGDNADARLDALAARVTACLGTPGATKAMSEGGRDTKWTVNGVDYNLQSPDDADDHQLTLGIARVDALSRIGH